MRDRTNLAFQRLGDAMNAAELADRLGFKKSGRMYVGPCVAHSDKNPSMVIYDGHTSVQVRCYAGCEPADIIAVLKQRGLWGGGDRFDHPVAQVARQRLAERASEVSRETQNQARALRIFDEAQALRSSELAMDYITGRKLTVPDALRCARFHPVCPRGAAEYVPAIVVLMEALDTSERKAVQRIFLRREPDGRVVKDGKPMMLGPAAGAAMKLTQHNDTFWDVMSYTPLLHVCEGFETGLALLERGYFPLWALGSAGAISALPVMFGVGRIAVCADHDEAGLAAADRCCRRWTEAGHPAELLHRSVWGKDFADV